MGNKLSVKSKKKVVEEASLREPYIKCLFKEHPKNGHKEMCSVELSDGTTSESSEFQDKMLKALKRTSGSEDSDVSELIISKIAWGMSSNDNEYRMRDVMTLLNTLEPKNETEALLLGQFLALQDSGFKCLRRANNQEMFFHQKEFFQLSTKLFRSANETMQALLKYRSGGKQQIQVIHVSGDGKAVVANEIHNGGG